RHRRARGRRNEKRRAARFVKNSLQRRAGKPVRGELRLETRDGEIRNLPAAEERIGRDLDRGQSLLCREIERGRQSIRGPGDTADSERRKRHEACAGALVLALSWPTSAARASWTLAASSTYPCAPPNR